MAALTDLTLARLKAALDKKEVSAAIAYSTTFGTVKKPPAFLSAGSI